MEAPADRTYIFKKGRRNASGNWGRRNGFFPRSSLQRWREGGELSRARAFSFVTIKAGNFVFKEPFRTKVGWGISSGCVAMIACYVVCGLMCNHGAVGRKFFPSDVLPSSSIIALQIALSKWLPIMLQTTLSQNFHT